MQLTTEEVNILIQLLNQASGMENVKLLLPIYEKLKLSLQPKEDLDGGN